LVKTRRDISMTGSASPKSGLTLGAKKASVASLKLR